MNDFDRRTYNPATRTGLGISPKTKVEEEMPLNDNDLAKVRAVVKDVMDEETGDGLIEAFDNLSDKQKAIALYYLVGYALGTAQIVYDYAKAMPR